MSPAVPPLRACPRSICCITYPSEHEADGCPTQKGQSIFVQTLQILGEAAASIEPADGSLHHQTLGKHGNRPFLTDRRLYHFRLEFRAVLLPDICHDNPSAQGQFRGGTLS